VQANTARSAHKQATKKKPVSMLLNALAIGLAVLVAAIGLLLAAGQAGLLRGKPPTLLGVQGGRLPPPHVTRNNVHSQAGIWGAQYAHTAIEPLPAQADGAQTMERLRSLVEATPGAQVVKAGPDHLYVQYTTKWLRFVDDAEFWFDPVAQRVQVRSASRLGEGDLGVNRARIEALRQRLASP
jgi:uncharacterized protein (DUF1499 family)